MDGPRIERIEQSKLRESAYSALRGAFMRGEFAPGTVVSLRTLADQLGTSMTPVREAVRRLVAEGAFVDTPSRKLEVPPFDERRMKDLKAARLALETLVLRQAFAAITPADIAALRAIIDRPSHAGAGPVPAPSPDAVAGQPAPPPVAASPAASDAAPSSQSAQASAVGSASAGPNAPASLSTSADPTDPAAIPTSATPTTPAAGPASSATAPASSPAHIPDAMPTRRAIDLEANHDFHFTLYRLSGSEVLLPMVEALWLQYGAYLNRIIHQDAALRLEEHAHHREIVQALSSGDLTAAEAALRADIDRSFGVLLPPD
ncbi:GntR family transcriptional regulator [Marinibacterium sp. SX1]|uniref:GntR family transcriptional regulator n=1 Tax=Marinibacterium sp. SX1 TaxID=3388424 RepID=UPI003D180103